MPVARAVRGAARRSPAVQARLADAALARDGLVLCAWAAADPEGGFPAATLAVGRALPAAR